MLYQAGSILSLLRVSKFCVGGESLALNANLRLKASTRLELPRHKEESSSGTSLMSSRHRQIPL